MTREILERRIHGLQDEVLLLGGMVQRSMVSAVAALRRNDLVGAQQVVARDAAINRRRFAIEDDVLTLMATQQPVAHDLRLLAAMLEVLTELERMADYSKGIGHIIVQFGNGPMPPNLMGHFDVMASKANLMLHSALRAFIDGDDRTARTLPAEDDEVDSLYNMVYRELIDWMLADPAMIDRASHLLWVAHDLERFADRVTNICERTIFTATGEIIEFSASGGD